MQVNVDSENGSFFKAIKRMTKGRSMADITSNKIKESQIYVTKGMKRRRAFLDKKIRLKLLRKSQAQDV